MISILQWLAFYNHRSRCSRAWYSCWKVQMFRRIFRKKRSRAGSKSTVQLFRIDNFGSSWQYRNSSYICDDDIPWFRCIWKGWWITPTISIGCLRPYLIGKPTITITIVISSRTQPDIVEYSSTVTGWFFSHVFCFGNQFFFWGKNTLGGDPYKGWFLLEPVLDVGGKFGELRRTM